MANDKQLSGQIAVVTGAGRGIGRAIAAEQAAQGAKVALLARSSAELAAAADEITAAGGAARPYSVDITDTAAVAATFAQIEGDLGPVTLLTNNAGAFAAIGPIWEVDPDAWWRDVETNIRGTFNCCRAVLPSMLRRRQGRIINFTGGGTGNSFPNGSGYGTSKAGLLRFTESVSDTLKGTGVTMLAMDPGLVRTSMTEYQLTSAAGQTYLTNIPDLFAKGINVPPDFAARLSVAIGAGRFDRMAGRMLMAARGDQELSADDVEEIVAKDLRSLRINGMPAERIRQLTRDD
jgi:NAD(P)-dependent dehydrogenase (short-subunit alcohol dehydrogenase family)